MTYGYQNEDGEPIMDGAAYRYEQYLDSQYEPDPDDFYNVEPEDHDDCDPDYDLDVHNGHAWCYTHDQNLDLCPGSVTPEDEANDRGEDEWLDGSYEE